MATCADCFANRFSLRVEGSISSVFSVILIPVTALLDSQVNIQFTWMHNRCSGAKRCNICPWSSYEINIAVDTTRCHIPVPQMPAAAPAVNATQIRCCRPCGTVRLAHQPSISIASTPCNGDAPRWHPNQCRWRRRHRRSAEHMVLPPSTSAG